MTDTNSIDIRITAHPHAGGWLIQASLTGPDGQHATGSGPAVRAATALDAIKQNPDAVLRAISLVVKSPLGFLEPTEDPGYRHL